MREPPVQQLRLQKGRRVTAHRPQEVEAGVREPPSPRENHLPPLHSPRRREGPPTNYKCIANSAVCVEGAGAGAGWVSSVMTRESQPLDKKALFLLTKGASNPSKGNPSSFQSESWPPLFLKTCNSHTSLAAEGLITRLPMQETRVRSLVREDPTCYEAMRPVHSRASSTTREATT